MSHPLATVPAMSKIPIRASRPALVVSGMPWSCAAGMKWVPIRPLVDQPQIQNVANRIQKVRDRALSRRVPSAILAAPRDSLGGAGGTQPSSAPYGVVPTSAGWSRSTTQTSGTSSSANPATRPAAHRQPGPSASCAMAGRKTSWPVELAAEKTPMTTPRWRTNQRFATIAPNTSAREPVPTPTANPHSSQSCQAEVMTRVSPEPAATSSSAAATTRRRPNLSIRAAANGAVSP